MHLVWGERTVPHPFDPQPDIILYSTNEGGTWSVPERIFHNPKHKFARAPGFVADAAGNLHMVVGVRDSLTDRPILVSARRSDGAWSQPRTIASAGLDPSIVDGGFWLIVGYIRPAMPVAGSVDVNSVFSIRSADHGVTWQDTTLVSRSGPTPASQPVAVATPLGHVYLIWLQDRTGDSFPEAILHSDSPDGVIWTRPRVAVEPGPGIQSFRAAVDRFGRIHLVYQLSGPGFPPQPPMRGFYTQWNGMSWSVPVRLFEWQGVGQVIAVAVSSLDSLHIAANVADFGSQSDIYFASAYIGTGANSIVR